MRIQKKKSTTRRNVFAAETDEYEEVDIPSTPSVGVEDTLETISDSLDDINDRLDEVEEDEVDIEVDNNIADHYIAECDRCKGVFISSVMFDDHQVSKIEGVCPLCEHDTTQYLKWVIESVE